VIPNYADNCCNISLALPASDKKSLVTLLFPASQHCAMLCEIMNSRFLTLFSWLALSLGIAFSQNAPATPSNPLNPNEEVGDNRFWQARFVNGSHYLVKLDRIATASKHEFIGNGAARVVEVTIGTDSAVVARFYYLEPLGKDTPIAAGQIVMDRAEQLAKQAAGRVSPNAAKLQVVKDYPTTTHAHTVDYVVQEEAVLLSLYESLLRSINTSKGRIWKESSGK
jgi:hypothetical protein